LSDQWADLQYAYPGDDTSVNGTNVYGNVKQLYLLKKKYRTLKTMLSIGGYTYSPNWSAILGSDAMRMKFATSAVKLMSNLGFDGLDFDY
jgi:chitinase